MLLLGLLAVGCYFLPWWIGSLIWGGGKSYLQPDQAAASFFADKAPQYVFGAAVVVGLVGLMLVFPFRRGWATVTGLAMVVGVPMLGYWSSATMRASFESSARSTYEYSAVPQAAVASSCTIPSLRWEEGGRGNTYQWSALLSHDCAAVAVFRGWKKVMVWPAGSGRRFLALARYYSGTLVAFTGRPGQFGDAVTAVNENDWRQVMWRTHVCAALSYNEIVSVSFAGQTGNEASVTPIRGDVIHYVLVECADRDVFLDPQNGHYLEVLRR